jgi:hypothetical protein
LFEAGSHSTGFLELKSTGIIDVSHHAWLFYSSLIWLLSLAIEPT